MLDIKELIHMTNISKISACTLIIALLGLSACNTIQGVGADIEAAGDAVENSAKKTKNY